MQPPALSAAFAATPGTGTVQAALTGGPRTPTVAGVTSSSFASGFDRTVTGAGASAPGARDRIAIGANAQGDGISSSSGFAALGIRFAPSGDVLGFRAGAPAGIDGVSLGLDGIFLGLAVSSATDRQAAFLKVSCGPFGRERDDLAAGSMALDRGCTELPLQKDIDVFASAGPARISGIDRGFRARVPEAASMALPGVGLPDLGLARRASRSDARRRAA